MPVFAVGCGLASVVAESLATPDVPALFVARASITQVCEYWPPTLRLPLLATSCQPVQLPLWSRMRICIWIAAPLLPLLLQLIVMLPPLLRALAFGVGGMPNGVTATDSYSGLAMGIGGQHFFDGKNGVRMDVTRHEYDELDGGFDAVSFAYVRRF